MFFRKYLVKLVSYAWKCSIRKYFTPLHCVEFLKVKDFKLSRYVCMYIHSLVMSLSWNFPSWAEPSWKVSEPRRAKLGTSIFELKPSWTFFDIGDFSLQQWIAVLQKAWNSALDYSKILLLLFYYSSKLFFLDVTNFSNSFKIRKNIIHHKEHWK